MHLKVENSVKEKSDFSLDSDEVQMPTSPLHELYPV